MTDLLASLTEGFTWPILGMLVLAGASVGLLAGIFGMGGGAISVPVFFETFRLTGVADEIAMPLAVGTSLAMIVPTSILSARSHAARGTVDWTVIQAWAAPAFVGVVIGSVIARYANPEVFQAVFVVVAGVNAVKMLFGAASWRLRDKMPGGPVTALYGLVIGLLSALMGIGGGAISNLVLTLNGKGAREAVSTSAAVGVIIAVPGSVGYVLAGWGRSGLPPDALGFVSILTIALTLPAAMLTTRLGVSLAHSLPQAVLTRLFGGFLALVCLRFLYEILV